MLGDNLSVTLVTDEIPLAMDAQGTYRVGGTRVTLDLVVRAFNRGATAEEIVQKYDNLRLPDVYQVIGYYLKRHGYKIVPVNPKETEILGEKSYPSLKDIPFPVDVVDVFRRPDAVPAIARETVAIGAKALWLQFNVISPEAAKIAEDGGLTVVMDRCMKVEHARHLGRMHWLGFNTGRVTARRERHLA